ncbi:hypothetical protein F5Y10DRAFT_69412 [Nemania abortiva]|nr:hypothetical protein F5Y10DRAFT_69412 [Nemania abortiva]
MVQSFYRPTGARTVPLPSKRAGSPRKYIQQSGVEHAKITQQPEAPYTAMLEPKAEEQEQVSPAMRSQKRQMGNSDDDDKEHRLKRARLTRKNLAQFDKMGKKKGTEAAPSALPDSTTGSTTTSGFAIQAYENGILGPSASKPPTNLEEIRRRYTEPRRSASPTESVYRGYIDTVEAADNEATMIFEVGGHLLKKYDNGYKRAFNQAFTGFPKDVGFNNSLSPPQPDFIEGLRMPEFRPFPVHRHIDGAVIYENNPGSITLPHLAGEWKGPDGHMKDATLQSAYDGAALVYARNKALAYLGKSDPPGHAQVTTFTTDGTNLNLYAHYATPSEDGMLEYHQYKYVSANMIDSYQEHKNGRKGLRNEQDHAFKQSRTLMGQLKGQWKQCRLQAIANGALPPVLDGTFETTNADEGEISHEIVETPCEHTPSTSSKPERLSN